MGTPKRLETALLIATPILYASAVALSALVVSLIVVYLVGPAHEGGEAWQALGIAWADLAVPTIMVLSIASMLVHSRYRRLNHWSSLALFYLANVAIVAGAGVAIAKVFGQ